jgi:hypothetical protein
MQNAMKSRIAGKRISDFTDDEIQKEFHSKLVTIIEFVGCTAIPSDEHLNNLVKLLKFNHPDITLEGPDELTLAFQLACGDKLKNVKVETWNSLSGQTMGMVMNGYKFYRLEKAKKDKELEQQKYTQDDYNRMGFEELDLFVKQYRRFPVAFLWKSAFAHIINETKFSLTEKEYNTISFNLRENLKAEYQERNISNELFESRLTEELVKEYFKEKYNLHETIEPPGRTIEGEKNEMQGIGTTAKN